MTDQQCVTQAAKLAFGEEAVVAIVAGARRSYQVSIASGPTYSVKFAPSDIADAARAESMAAHLSERRATGTL